MTGHSFHGREWFECHAVGYVESLAAGLSPNLGASCVGTPAEQTRQQGTSTVGITQYCGATSGFLVIELKDSDPPEKWHASDLVVDFIGGGSAYHKTAADHVRILAAEHNDAQTF